MFPQSDSLCLGAGLLLVRDSALARAFAGPGVGVGTLSANGKIAAMTAATVTADLNQPLDVHRNVLAQIALDIALALDHLTDMVHFLFSEVLNLLVGIHIGGCEDARGAWMSDAIDVTQRDVHMLVSRKINACNTCHKTSFASLSLTLFMLGVLADHTHHAPAVDDLALITNLLYRCSYFHNPSR